MEDIANIEIFGQCLRAAAHGPFLEDWEFQILTGFDRPEFIKIADAFDVTTPIKGDVADAIQTAMANLLGYPHGMDSLWSNWISVPQQHASALLAQWLARRERA